MAAAFARRRLLRDLAEVQKEPSELVSALPLGSDIFEWHANLRPSSGPLEGVVLHVRIVFPANYPDSPPNMLFPMDQLPSFVHPNLYPFGLCLDILSSYIGSEDKRAGWSPAYGVRTLLLQLQSFLFEFDAAPQDHGGRYSASHQYDAKRIAQIPGAAGATSLTVRVVALASEGYVRLGFSTSLGSSFVGWDSRGTLVCGKAAKAAKAAMPSPAVGDVMSVAVRDDAVRFLHNGQLVDAAAPAGGALRALVAGGASAPLLCFRGAAVEVLPDEVTQRAEEELRRLQAEEQDLGEQVQAEEQQWRAQMQAEDQRLEALKRAEAKAAEELRAAEAWARVLAPPCSTPRPRETSKQRWLRLELADLARPLHEGSAQCRWSLLRPPLLMKAFSCLDASDVAPLARTCRVWRRLAVRSSLMERVQLRCFYTKATAEEDVLGFGAHATYHEDGNLKSVSTELDVLSATAFHLRRLRRGVWGDEFTHFLPLVLNAEHGQRALPDLELALAALACSEDMDPSRGDRRFEPWMALAVIPQLMNSFVVSLMSSGGDAGQGGAVPRHASERALLGYCSFHHMLLALSSRHPSIVQVANEQLQKFVAGERTKSKVPDLGQLIVYLSVSDAVPWQAAAAAIMEESQVRGVLWVLRAQPRLARGAGDKALLAGVLNERLISVRLLMFQAYFLRALARPNGESLSQALDRYNRQFGLPTAPQKEMLVQATRQVLGVRSWPEVYSRLGLSAPPPAELAEEIREAMDKSADLGYHNAAVLGPFGRPVKGGRASQEERVGVQQSLQRAFGSSACAAPRQDAFGPSATAEPRAAEGRPRLVLTALEEVEANKSQKALRAIAKLERRAAEGEKLDILQLRKIGRKHVLESLPVMLKVRSGYSRR